MSNAKQITFVLNRAPDATSGKDWDIVIDGEIVGNIQQEMNDYGVTILTQKWMTSSYVAIVYGADGEDIQQAEFRVDRDARGNLRSASAHSALKAARDWAKARLA